TREYLFHVRLYRRAVEIPKQLLDIHRIPLHFPPAGAGRSQPPTDDHLLLCRLQLTRLTCVRLGIRRRERRALDRIGQVLKLAALSSSRPAPGLDVTAAGFIK